MHLGLQISEGGFVIEIFSYWVKAKALHFSEKYDVKMKLSDEFFYYLCKAVLETGLDSERIPYLDAQYERTEGRAHLPRRGRRLP